MFRSCLNPQKVFNSSLGQYITVGCGRCRQCRKQYEKIWARRLERHAQAHGLVLFFTLTYDNYHLPKVYYNDKGIVTNFTRTQEFNFYNRHTGERTQITKVINSHEFNGTNVFTLQPDGTKLRPPRFVRRRLKGREPEFDDKNRFAIAYKKDFQLFIMRCRTILRRYYANSDFDPTFTYFGVSEYGPKTYRPHFHGMLFFSEPPEDLQALLSLLSKAWAKSPSNKVGREFEVVLKKDASSKYVSKYVVKDSSLPLILLTPEFCTSSFKSISIPLGSKSFDLSDVPAIFSKGTLLYHEQYFDKEKGCFVPYKCSHPSVSWQRIFPKFIGRSLLDISQMRRIIDRIFYYRERTQEWLVDLADRIKSKYPIGFFKDLLSRELIDQWIYGTDDEFIDDYFEKAFDLSMPNNPNAHRATFSDFFDLILAYGSEDLDYFLLCNPKNLTFVRKVLAASHTQHYLMTAYNYCEHYLRYETIAFTDSLKYVHEQYDECPTAFEFSSIYSEFYEKLYPSISGYTAEQVTRLDMILSNFNLTLGHFYHDDGTKIQFDFSTSRDIQDFELAQELEVRKTNSVYQSEMHDDL